MLRSTILLLAGLGLLGTVAAGAAATSPRVFPADTRVITAKDPHIQYSGRTEGIGTDKVTFGWSGARIRLRFQGSSSVGLWLEDDSGDNYAMAWIDGGPGRKFRLDARDGFYPLADGLGAGEHTVEVVRVTEGFLGRTHFRGFVLERGAGPVAWRLAAGKRGIEFIGDSITCGYGVEVDDPNLHFEPATENFCLGYSGLAARELEADYVVVARSGIGMVRNYDGPRDGSEDTMPQVYPATFYNHPERIGDARSFQPDVVCLNLGTNDFSTTGVNVEKFIATYAEFLRMLLARYPDAKIVLLQGPMDTSAGLRSALNAVRDGLSANDRPRVHFLALSPQGSVGLGADYHPNRAQSRINAAELASFLRQLMGWQ